MGLDGYLAAAAPAENGGGFWKTKKGAATSRSWIMINAKGEGTILDIDKYEVMHRVQINARDLRIIDPLLSYPSTIFGRERAIVLNLEHIKAIITHDEVLLREPSDHHVIPVIEELCRRLPVGNVSYDVEMGEEAESPFEFRALEVILESICSFLDARTTELESDTYPALDLLISKISSHNSDHVRKLRNTMRKLIARVQKVRDELEQLLNDDDDMAELYLSRKMSSFSPVLSDLAAVGCLLDSPIIGSKRSKAGRASITTMCGDENDVEEIEQLLEAYFMQIGSTANKLTTLREHIDDTKDCIRIQLDHSRNELIKLELFLNSGNLGMSVFSLITGILGMNIPFAWNDNHGYMFKWVVIFGVALGTFIVTLCMSIARWKRLI